ncbi:Mitochondrial pyruvate carrier 2 [Frankliniella fusca]|uniref:Mitochondrial pyruvate carrier n=1 Tax=Frankliniella fusca TaxID=407009 RepID=A0AAE1HR42_9NEOP|nr:Mitochondrial pyruvate carrier 2 [Frankliniella fusca]
MSVIYRRSMAYLDKFVPPKYAPLWNHPADHNEATKPFYLTCRIDAISFAGPKTIFFWSPWFKWGLVIAGLSDVQRPAETVSVSQSAALAVTGIIWSRYCLVITPINYNLCAVNVFVALVGSYQFQRAARQVLGGYAPHLFLL